MLMHAKMFVFVGLVILLMMTGCNDGSTGPDADAPEVPPVSTMEMNFSDFQDGSQSSLNKIASVQSKQNWTYAAITVGVWSLIAKVHMVLPVAAFRESFRHDPEQQDDGSWLWSYNFNYLGIAHTAKLYGEIVDSKVQWNMYMSRSSEYTDFLWYSGESDLLATEGQWILYMEPENPKPYLQIDWHRDRSDLTGDLKYTSIVPESEDNGSYIKYEITTETDYNAYFDVYDVAENNLTEIEWNRLSKIGRVRNTVYFEDNEWHCWDELHNDVACE